MGSSRKDLRAFPDDVRGAVGHAVNEVQKGFEPDSAKALKGFGVRAILEIVEDHDGDTYRAVYTVRFAGVVYILHAFQKKSKKGIKTPQTDIDKIKSRLKDAEEHYKTHFKEGGQS